MHKMSLGSECRVDFPWGGVSASAATAYSPQKFDADQTDRVLTISELYRAGILYRDQTARESFATY